MSDHEPATSQHELFRKPVGSGIPIPLLITFAIAAFAFFAGRWVPTIGAPIFAIVAGIILTNVLALPVRWHSGTALAGKYLLQIAIVFIGATLSLTNVAQVGTDALIVTIGALIAGLAFALLAGGALGVPWRMRCLIGAGTSICGASAIAATAPAIRAQPNETAQAISIIFLFNIIAVFVFPAVGLSLGFSDQRFGVWAGTAVNDTSAVVAVGYAYSDAAGNLATLIKLGRTVMIIPVVAVLGFITARREPDESSSGSARRTPMPVFILLFVAAAALNSFGLLPYSEVMGAAGKFLLLMALAAVGMQARFGDMLKVGTSQIGLGLLTWAVVALTSLGLQQLMGVA